VGDKKYVVCSRCDYAATTEAVVTPAPPPGDPGAWPALSVHDTPDTPTIESLVALANAQRLGGRADWTAADTLKNVVVLLTHPDGSTEPLAVGLPGDRDVDPKRLDAQVAPAEWAPFEEKDFAAYPMLAKGCIGPAVLGLEKASGIRYLLDPSVAEGSAWVTGADEHGKHVFDLVLGRDFTAARPNQRYVGALTYLPVADGPNLYLATVIDLCSRKLAGWQIADHMRVGLVEDALRTAARDRGSLAGSVFHSDHGSV